MKNFKLMNMSEIENEIMESRQREKNIEKELDTLITFAQELKSKLCNSQTSLELKIVDSNKRKSIPQRIVELIKQNSGKLNSNDIYEYFAKDQTYPSLDMSKKNLPTYISRLNGTNIKHEKNGEPWVWIKDLD